MCGAAEVYIETGVPTFRLVTFHLCSEYPKISVKGQVGSGPHWHPHSARTVLLPSVLHIESYVCKCMLL